MAADRTLVELVSMLADFAEVHGAIGHSALESAFSRCRLDVLAAAVEDGVALDLDDSDIDFGVVVDG